MKFKTFSAAFTAEPSQEAKPKLVAANDNKPARHRGNLPALNWLFKNHPSLAQALAMALPKPASNWFAEVEPSRREMRPTVGELMTAAGAYVEDEVQKFAPVEITPRTRDKDPVRISVGTLKFRDGLLVEWGVTKKGVKLRPVDRLRSAGSEKPAARNVSIYLGRRATTPSPMAAEH